jgi:hypothetical protein
VTETEPETLVAEVDAVATRQPLRTTKETWLLQSLGCSIIYEHTTLTTAAMMPLVEIRSQ